MAAFRALAEFELEGHGRIRASARPGGRTLRRHAVLGEAVASLPAQQAWQRYWSDHMGRAPRMDRGSSAFAEMESRRALTDGWLAARTAWTARA